MTTLKLFGVEEGLNAAGPGSEAMLSGAHVAHAVRLVQARAGETPDCTIQDLADTDVIELTFEGNARRWLTLAEFKAEFKPQLPYDRQTQAEPGEVIIVPGALPANGQTRGALAYALKALRIFKFDPAAGFLKSMAAAFDDKLMAQPGLYFFNDSLNQRGPAVKPGDLDPHQPLLLFFHGTFSSVEGSFGKLPDEVWQNLRRHYPGRIAGLEHRTLSETPAENLLALLPLLPAGARLHLVTHSRGGLLGELLCRSQRNDQGPPFDALDLKVSSETERTQLAQLSGLLQEKRPEIERFVRVACPAGGTTLASGRMDRWLELSLNLLGKLTGASANLVYGVLVDLLLEIKKQSANPAALPGVAVMTPDSALIRLLNRPDLSVQSGLAVISGDIQGARAMNRMLEFFTDRFYREEHDLVVQTRAMYGGARRATEGLFFFDQGQQVDHFHYFLNQKTATSLQLALTEKPAVLKAAGFRPISEALRSESARLEELSNRSYQKRSGIPQPSVFIVPGIMGSHLAEGHDRIWIDLLDLALGGIERLQINAGRVQAQVPVALAYAELVEYLSSSHEVIPFAYDWRRSIQDAADRLAAAVEAKFEQTDQPVRIVAHSMGGLVSLAMFARHKALFEKFGGRPGCRLVLLGVPTQGSFAIPRMLLGQEETLRALAIVDLKHTLHELLEIIVRFPGVLELLPADDTWDFFKTNTWQELQNIDPRGCIVPDQASLTQARRTRALIDGCPIDERWMVYVAGCAPNTPIDLEITLQDARSRAITFIASDEGDGRVPWRTGPPKPLKPWYLPASHGDLSRARRGLPAIYDLLQQGTTNRLAQEPPPSARAAERRYRMAERELDVYPDQTELEQLCLGIEPEPRLHPIQIEAVKVSIAHGNLAFSQWPVAVGHYEGEPLLRAEKHLDHNLDGQLNARYQLGLYPGPLGTAAVLLNPARKPGGAIVVGLGQTGELSALRLHNAFKQALIEYAIQLAEHKTRPENGQLQFTSLLVGSTDPGLSIDESIGAILDAILQANRALAQMPAPYQVQIQEVQFIEIYEDLALEATRALRKFGGRPEFRIESRLCQSAGGHTRLTRPTPDDWWNRLMIRKGSADSLLFARITSRARNEEVEVPIQRRVIERLIAQAVNDPTWDPELGSPIFELLMPVDLKSYAPDINKLVLMVDPTAASYPWELMYDRRSGSPRPMAVTAGMIRQLTTTRYRPQVIDVRNRSVLVVGDPAGLPPNFAPLPGARQEAQVVSNQFRAHGYQTVALIEAGFPQIMTRLFAGDYRVLHFAGHGVFEHPHHPAGQAGGEPQLITGMVLGEGVFLTAIELKQLGRVPELVFINCCHLGRLDPLQPQASLARPEFAASLAQSLIEMGVKAVVAAGWAVDDAAALTFADQFYGALLSGEGFGNAVHLARRAVYELHGDRANTWGAYQCYGDPFYRLVFQHAGGSPQTESWYVDRAEAIVAVQNLAQDARVAAIEKISSLRANLEAIYAEIQRSDPQWLSDPELNEALGWAYSEVDLFGRAVQHYQAAFKSPKSRLSIHSIEQMANLQARQAVQQQTAEQAREWIEGSLDTLNRLVEAFGANPERLALLGSAYKRWAQISSGEACLQALSKMQSYYRQAWNEAEDGDPYPLVNALVADVLLYWLGATRARPKLHAEMNKVRTLARRRKVKHPQDFWAAIGEADVNLAGYLLEGNPGSITRLAASYRQAWEHYGSARELSSVIEHIEFLRALLAQGGGAYDSDTRSLQRKQLESALQDVKVTLQQMLDK